MAAHEGDRPETTRASDAERERAVAALNRHYVDGRLTTEEFSDRAHTAYAARTLADLERLFDDLPRLGDLPAVREAAGTADSTRAADVGPPPRRTRPPAGVLVAALVAAVVLGAMAFGDAGDREGRGFFPLWPLLFWSFVVPRILRHRRG